MKEIAMFFVFDSAWNHAIEATDAIDADRETTHPLHIADLVSGMTTSNGSRI
ncbi:hypothetical protein [Paraburkholderia jirisanensis]